MSLSVSFLTLIIFDSHGHLCPDVWVSLPILFPLRGLALVEMLPETKIFNLLPLFQDIITSYPRQVVISAGGVRVPDCNDQAQILPHKLIVTHLKAFSLKNKQIFASYLKLELWVKAWLDVLIEGLRSPVPPLEEAPAILRREKVD